MPSSTDNECAACGKTAEDTVFRSLRRCAGCRMCRYCSTDCQVVHWPYHKDACKPAWHGRHRKCDDGSHYETCLELITWTLPGSDVGWGNVILEEQDSLKRKFEVEYGGDEGKFFDYWPQGFRWTCCGVEGSNSYGCYHHGTGRKSCTCDFCKMGQPLPDSIYEEATPSRHGLELSRGPDRRSFVRPTKAMRRSRPL